MEAFQKLNGKAPIKTFAEFVNNVHHGNISIQMIPQICTYYIVKTEESWLVIERMKKEDISPLNHMLW